MVSPHGIKLAVYLISSYFGDLNAKVCDCLLRRGTQPLSQIVHFTEFSRENVKSCLLVLIHHNYVQAFAVQQKGDSSVDTARDSFNSLVNARYVERCPAPEAFLKPPSEEETAAKKRGAKSAKISDTTFVEKKDAVKILCKLWKDEYLEMKKVITQGARQSEFILWKINKQSLWKHVLDKMYHAALNLRLRITNEREQGKEILQMPREKLVGGLSDRHTRLRKIWITLESSLMNLDDALMLFHDF
ncbi:uncharacterized protein LOC107853471 isoform X2 [Capsicum annuum]|uniref:uncharacterized protein LOC107853471 isoform X2 n=1 Tax=Capsicum annuum TaxID=4072 RepID=UPI0007BFE042|nr:uncharacterized protein LOC107853471 isoform X2 [Capsicum annuum]